MPNQGEKKEGGSSTVSVWMSLDGSHANMWIQVHKEDGRKPFG